MLDRPATIYLNSPQVWSALKVSKHHYARALAARGHTVYFIEPPGAGGSARPVVSAGPCNGLAVVNYRTFFPYALKFHARAVFDTLMRRQARRIVRAIGRAPDIVWDFDNAGQYADLSAFGDAFRIFHPVDDLAPGARSAKSADIVVSNAQRYLDRLVSPPRFARVVGHGLTAEFIDRARAIAADPAAAGPPGDPDRPLVAYVGNLEHPGIDWPAIEAMTARASQARFMMIGPFGERPDAGPPASLRARANVEFTGPRSSAQILTTALGVDVWLMAYDPSRDVNGGTNPHKLLEYLATGKAIVSNWAEAYAGTDLVTMPRTPDNATLPDLLADTLGRLESVNALAERRRRAAHTLAFSYDAHLAAIDALAEEARAYGRAKGGAPGASGARGVRSR